MTGIRIERARALTPAVVDAVGRLLPQLTPSATHADPDALAAVVASPDTSLLLAYDGQELVGMLTLVVVRTPTGTHALVEDVVVDEAARGRGAGRQLMLAAVDRAEHAGAGWVELTSRPSREAANAMYRGLGFERRETNVYRLPLGS